MSNIFENAKFGDKFRTRDGRMAIYWVKAEPDYNALILDDCEVICNNEGKEIHYFASCNMDIASRWQEEINEEELDELANEDAEKAYILKDSNYNLWYLVTETFKRGYRKAKGL